jgi:large subunit ribosomal protein L9
MDIILLERIEKLGAIGDVVTVKDGFARNFLLPNKKALRANASNKKLFESNRAKIEADNDARRTTALDASKDVDGTEIVLIRQASNAGALYGSVAARDLVDALHEAGKSLVTKSMIVLERPIKTLGLFDVRVSLHPEVSVTIKINVARSPEEADMQKAGIDVMSQMFEKEESGFTEEFISEDEESDAEKAAAPDQKDNAEPEANAESSEEPDAA